MSNYDVMIIGAGLAGLSTAAHLIEQKKGIQVLIYEARKISSGASGVPGGMVNPVTGQKANIVWNAEKGMSLLEKRLKTLEAHSSKNLFKETGIIRPAVDDQLAERLSYLFKKRNLPKEWMEWLNEINLAEKVPGLKHSAGGLFIYKGKVVQTPEYLKAYAEYLESNGVTFQFGGPSRLKYHDAQWSLQCGRKVIKANQIVVAAGSKSRENRFWIDLPIRSVKGQLALYESDTPLDNLPAVSAYGYIAPLGKHTLAVGSTYESIFDDENPDEHASKQLDDRLKDLLPSIYPSCRKVGLWSGIRATTPDRLPIAGKHPEYDTMYIYTGLGSKGLLLSEVVAEQLVQYLLYNERLPNEISLYRFAKYRRLRQIALEDMNNKSSSYRS
ncbi:FAD-dependent oxidoreductase [Balneolaceae bacterium ANBcel3]|nr:FAD-dependent oxidoreductase [Balneolaceae bacterium ANBcel3]